MNGHRPAWPSWMRALAAVRRARVATLLAGLLLATALLLAAPLPPTETTVAAAQASCTPRPSYTPQVALAGEGRLRVTVTGGAPPLQSVTIPSAVNARILLDGQPGPATLPLTIPSAGGAPIAFTVEQLTASQAVTVPLIVVDGCGSGETLVGSGAPAWWTPTPTPTATPHSCTPRPSAAPAVANMGGGRLQVTIGGGAPPLRSVTVKGLTNARLFMGDQQFVGTPPTTVPSNNGAPIVLTLEQIDPNQPVTVPLDIVDGCGTFTTFVGSGVAGFYTPTPALTAVASVTATVTVTPTATVAATATQPSGPQPPPDPAGLAPPVADNGVTTIGASVAFLYTGGNAIQTGVSGGAIEEDRVAVLRGRIIQRSGGALQGAVITIKDHPELGQTVSRTDGRFDLAVNGGGQLILNVARDGYLPAQRWIETPWQDFVIVDDIALVQRDVETTIDLAAPAAMQVARGSAQTDSDGSRRATLLFPQGTTAQMVMPNNSTQPITTLGVTATEYSVGQNGQAAMAADLPPNSGYTYMAEFRVTQAEQAGAVDVLFNPPLPFYVENFLDMPVGATVPLGAYDRRTGSWTTHESGRVIRIVSITGGLADLDLDGNGTADTGGALTALEITDAERQQLASLYTVNQTLWRMQIPHFDSVWDANWAFFPPDGAYPPKQPTPVPEGECGPCDTGRVASIIEAGNQVLRETLSLVGVPYRLNYSSERTPGFAAAYSLRVPITGASMPNPQPKSVTVQLHVAGKIIEQSHGAAPNQTVTMSWDGKDVYGRDVLGKRVARVRIGYVYDAVYQATPAFGYNGNGLAITGSRSRFEVTLWQDHYAPIGSWDAREHGLGGWVFDVLHTYDPVGRTLYLGDGGRRSVDSLTSTLNSAAGNGVNVSAGDGGPATIASISHPTGVAVGPDGSVYALSNPYPAAPGADRIRKIAPNGTISTFAGAGGQPFSVGALATDVNLQWMGGVLVMTRDGSLLFTRGHQILRIDPTGRLRVVAGTGGGGFSGDGGPATSAVLNGPSGVAVGPDDSIYISDGGNNRIRKVSPDGIIQTIVGAGGFCYDNFSEISCFDGAVATAAVLPGSTQSLAVTPDGTLYFQLGSLTVRLGADGRLRHIGGHRYAGSGIDDGVPASQADHFNIGIGGLAAGPDGSLYLSVMPHANHIIRRIRPDGIIDTVAGVKGMVQGFNGDGNPARAGLLHGPGTPVIGPDGALYIGDFNNGRVRRVTASLTGFTGQTVDFASDDGTMVYTFSGAGRHLQTRSTLTGATLLSFGYDGAGRLTSITDGDGNITTVERNGSGAPVTIVGPHGHRTSVALDGNGFLQAVTSPANETNTFGYSTRGLMTSLTTPRTHGQTFSYTANGLLQVDNQLADGSQTLSRTNIANGRSVEVETELGRSDTYLSENVVSGTNAGSRRALTTDADGNASESFRLVDNSARTTLTDGTVVTSALLGDPRYGMQAAYTSGTGVVTGGKTRTEARTRTVSGLDPLNLFQFTTLTDTIATNGRTAATSVYTRASRTRVMTSSEGRTATMVMDAQARTTSSQVTGLDPITHTYDGRGRPDTMVVGSGGLTRTVTMTYHPDGTPGQQAPAGAGMLATVTDPISRVTSFVYDLAGRVVSTSLPGGRTVAMGYDADGNLTSVTPPGGVAHVMTHAEDGLLLTYTPPDPSGGLGSATHRTTYTYNADRQLDLVNLPGSRQLDFQYDGAGRPSALAMGSGVTVGRTYDGNGRLQTLTRTNSPTRTYAYTQGLLTSVGWGGGGQTNGSVEYDYDNDLRMASVTVNGVNPITYAYDDDGQLTAIGALTLTQQAAPASAMVTGSTLTTPGVNIADAATFNTLAELTAYQAGQGGSTSNLYQLALGRDGLGRITSRTDTVEAGPAAATTYTYDTAGRLETASVGGVTTTYGYSLNGNRTTVQVGANPVQTATYDAQDRLVSFGVAGAETAYTYLLDGYLASRTPFGGSATTFTYDETGNLLQVAPPGGAANQLDYVVDGTGRRVERRKAGAVTHRWIYLDALRPAAELDGSNAVVSRFVYGGRLAPDYMIRGGQLYRLIQDHLGSVRLVVRQDGVVVQRLDYDPWGAVLADTNPGFQPFGFAGGLYDPDSGLVRFGVRDYDPAIGRWTAKDAVRFHGGGTNLYAYANNDPANLVDAEGTVPKPPPLPNRGPDYAVMTASAGLGYPALKPLLKGLGAGWSGAVILDLRYGHVYLATGPGAGRVHGTGAQVALGWLLNGKDCPPTEEEIKTFLDGNGYSAGYSVPAPYPSANMTESMSDGRRSVEIGLSAGAGFGGGASHAEHKGQIPIPKIPDFKGQLDAMNLTKGEISNGGKTVKEPWYNFPWLYR